MLKPEFTGQFKRDYKLALKTWLRSEKVKRSRYAADVKRNLCRKHIEITLL